MVWGNGGCIDLGTIMAPFLLQVASQGITIIANGIPESQTRGMPSRSPKQSMTQALDWAKANAGRGEWAHFDTSRIAAAGQSCGDGEAYGVAKDPRVTQIGVFNSGGMGGSVKGFTKPVFYFLGGPKDMAYNNVSMFPPSRKLLMSRLGKTRLQQFASKSTILVR
jgi:hypothetical protein